VQPLHRRTEPLGDRTRLHEAVWNVHTAEQKAWLIANRPKPPMPLGPGGR
jgi:hypothetical protein